MTTTTPPPTRKSRILGALLGVHAGDSLGATLEFRTWESIRAQYPHGLRSIIGGGAFRWPAGHATDDTDLTRAVLLAYHDRASSAPDADSDIVALAGKHMLAWLHGEWPGRQPGLGPSDIGNATRVGLLKFLETDGREGGAGEGQAGNGSLMRCIPTGLFVGDRATRIAHSVGISGITHDDARCTVACAAYNEVVAALVGGMPAQEAVEVGVGVARELDSTGVVAQAIRLGTGLRVAELAEKGPKNHLAGKAGGYVLESLTLAVAAVLDPRELVEVLVDVCRVGGDTDTNGAIAGGLLGARDGVGALPEEWLGVLQFREEFERVAGGLVDAAAAKAEGGD